MQTNHSNSRFWLMLVVMLAFAAACSAQKPASPLPQAPGTAQLIIVPSPDGVQVVVDGEVRGASPLTLTLPAGEHRIALAAAGFTPFSETITLDAGREATYAPDLEDVEPPVVTIAIDTFQVAWQGQAHVRAVASDNAGVLDIELALEDQTLAAAAGSELNVDFTPAEIPGIQPGRTYTLTATATDAAGNTGSAWLPLIIGARQAITATATPTTSPATPSPTPTPRAGATASPSPTVLAPTPTRPVPVSFRATQITIPTYPYKAFLHPAADPTMSGYPVLTLDRTAYEASNPKPAPVTYTLLILENRYLRVSFLPELGGRIYEVVFKPIGNNELYHNPVIKPTQWGPPSPPYPAGDNWWLGAGGIEWGFPVEEHGYEWGKEWGYDSIPLPDGSMQVSVLMQDPTWPYATVNITLAPEAAYFTVEPTVANPTEAPARVKWWSSATLAPGSANKPGPDLRFIFPASQVTVHSTGDPNLPGPGQPMSWPIYEGRDMSRLGNWDSYLGFFERPAAQGAPGPNGAEGFMGVYDTAADEGMMRVYPSEVTRGAKGFAMGWNQPLPPSIWTDDGSSYVELHGGLMPTFDEWYELPPDGQVSWQEMWYPVAGIGGVTHATAAAALHLAPEPGALRVSLFPTTPVQGQLRIVLSGAAPIVKPVTIDPAQPFSEAIPLPAGAPDRGDVSVTLVNTQGKTLYEYRGEVSLK